MGGKIIGKILEKLGRKLKTVKLKGDDNVEIKEAIAKLPPKERTVVEYRFYRNMQVKDIATQVGLSSSRVTRIVQASLNFVRDYLGSKDLHGY